MAKFILENKVVYDSVSHSLFILDSRSTQVTLAIPASLCLLALLKSKDEVVSLDQLLLFAWGARGMNVSNNAIYQNISILRKSLVNIGLSPDIIKTVPKRGFVVSSEKFVEYPLCSKTENIIENPPVISDVKSKFKIRMPATTLIMIISIVTLAVSCIISFLGVYSLTIYNEDSVSNYIYPDFLEIHQETDCHIYRNKSETNDTFFTDFIAYHRLNCGEQKWWYIFNYPPTSQTFILRCSSDLLSSKKRKDIICSSDYYY